jgi:hypothetical protein
MFASLSKRKEEQLGQMPKCRLFVSSFLFLVFPFFGLCLIMFRVPFVCVSLDCFSFSMLIRHGCSDQLVSHTHTPHTHTHTYRLYIYINFLIFKSDINWFNSKIRTCIPPPSPTIDSSFLFEPFDNNNNNTQDVGTRCGAVTPSCAFLFVFSFLIEISSAVTHRRTP